MAISISILKKKVPTVGTIAIVLLFVSCVPRSTTNKEIAVRDLESIHEALESAFNLTTFEAKYLGRLGSVSNAKGIKIQRYSHGWSVYDRKTMEVQSKILVRVADKTPWPEVKTMSTRFGTLEIGVETGKKTVASSDMKTVFFDDLIEILKEKRPAID